MNLKSAMLLFLLVTFSQITIAGGDANVVTIKGYSFNPQEITIKRGQTIRWENNEKIQYHSVWFEELDEKESDYFFPEESYQREFKKTGSFPYRCGPHPKMTGTVHVTD
jgi:plastocyanin